MSQLSQQLCQHHPLVGHLTALAELIVVWSYQYLKHCLPFQETVCLFRKPCVYQKHIVSGKFLDKQEKKPTLIFYPKCKVLFTQANLPGNDSGRAYSRHQHGVYRDCPVDGSN